LSALGQKADIAAVERYIRFYPRKQREQAATVVRFAR
jgi:hypothetical protein